MPPASTTWTLTLVMTMISELDLKMPAFYMKRLQELSSAYEQDPARRNDTLARFEADWDFIDPKHDWIIAHLDEHDLLKQLCIGYAKHGWRLISLNRGGDVALAWLEPALAAAQALGKRRTEATLREQLATTLLSLGKHAQAEAMCAQALDLCRSFDPSDARQEARLQHLLGQTQRNAGENIAQQQYKQALAQAEAVGDDCLQSRILIDLGNILANQGFYREGLDHYDRAVAAMQRGGCADDRDEQKRQGYIGNAQRNLGNFDEAIAAYERAIDLCERLRDPQQAGVQRFNLSLVYRDTGEFEQQKAILEAALEDARLSADDRGFGKVMNGLGTYYAYMDDYEGAVDAHHKGLARIEAVGARFIAAYIKADLAQSYLLFGEYDHALLCLFPALDMALEREHEMLTQQRHTLIARCHLQRGELHAARQQLELARQWDHEGDTTVSRHLSAVLHGVVLVRLAARRLAAAERAAVCDAARNAFDDALDFAADVKDYTAPYCRGLAQSGLALLAADRTAREEWVAAAREAYQDARDRCPVPMVVKDHLSLFDELLKKQPDEPRAVLQPVRSVLAVAGG